MDLINRLTDRLTDNVDASTSRLDVKVWSTGDRDFGFPEQSDPDLRKRQDIGIAFSGGGTRSMGLSLGYLRAFGDMGLLARTRYFGAISGGSWATVPYCWLPEDVPDHRYLGEAVPPAELTPARLAKLKPSDGIMARHISQSGLVLGVFGELAASLVGRSLALPKVPFLDLQFGLDDIDEVWGRIIGQVFLRDLGLEGDRYAAWRPRQVNGMVERNRTRLGGHRLEADDFFVQQNNRPFLCVNGAMNQDAALLPDEDDTRWRPMGALSWDHIEFTPMYSGIHRRSSGRLQLPIGGGYCENIGLDTLAPVRQSDGQTMTVSPGLIHHRFSVQDIMAVSGAAPAYLMHALARWKSVLPDNFGAFKIFPKLRYWPVAGSGKPVTAERCFGDGGYVDNYGLIPLLKRKVRRIIVLVNTEVPLLADRTLLQRLLRREPTSDELLQELLAGRSGDTFMHTLFGVRTPAGLSSLSSPSDFLQPGRVLGREQGQVLESRDHAPLMRALFRAHVEGGPAAHLEEHVTVANELFGIEGGHRCKILWIYNDRSQRWFESLPVETRHMIEGRGLVDKLATRDKLATVPRTATFLAGLGSTFGPDAPVLKTLAREGLDEAVRMMLHDSVVDLSPAQTLLLASHAHHCATALAPLIRRHFIEAED